MKKRLLAVLTVVAMAGALVGCQQAGGAGMILSDAELDQIAGGKKRVPIPLPKEMHFD